MRGKIASSANFELVAFEITGLIAHFGTDRINIRSPPNQFQTQPVIFRSGAVTQQNRSSVVLRYQNIDGAVMTPEQYVSFVRNAWGLIGVSGGREEGGKK